MTGTTGAVNPDPTVGPDEGQSRDPNAIRRDIAGTRRDMDRTLDQIEGRVSPRRIAERRTERVKGGWQRTRARVMGSIPSTGGSGGGVRETGQQAADRAREAPQRIEEGTRGNPLAAGLIAFGAGLLAASALPKTQKEHEAAQAATERLQPLKEELTEAGKDVASNVQEHAKEAAQHTQETAKDAAASVQEDAKGSAQSLRDESKDRASSVRDTAQS